MHVEMRDVAERANIALQATHALIWIKPEIGEDWRIDLDRAADHSVGLVILDPQTQTLYTANWVDNDVSVIDATRCNAQATSGCRHPAPAVTLPGPGGVAVDPAVHTTYVTTASNAVAMIDTRRCNAHHPAGCATPPPTAAVGASPDAIAVDRRTHTVYVANQGAGSTGTVSVLDARTCNAS